MIGQNLTLQKNLDFKIGYLHILFKKCVIQRLMYYQSKNQDIFICGEDEIATVQ